MARKKSEENVSVGIELQKMELKTLCLKLIGDSPLIVHAWSEKAKREMLEKQMKKASKGREAKDPFRDFCDSLYWLTEKSENPTWKDIESAKFGFPSIGFKASAIDGAYQSKVTKNKTSGRAAFHVTGEMVEIEGKPTMREDMVRIGGQSKTADIRYRAEFREWSVVLEITYNALAISAEQIVNMFNFGGFSTGVGEWRPQRNGSYGMFHVATENEW